MHNKNDGNNVDEEEDYNVSDFIPPGCEEEENFDDEEEDNDKEEDGCNGGIEALEKGLGGMSFATLILKLPTLINTWYDEVGTERCYVDILLISGTIKTQLKVAVQKEGN